MGQPLAHDLQAGHVELLQVGLALARVLKQRVDLLSQQLGRDVVPLDVVAQAAPLEDPGAQELFLAGLVARDDQGGLFERENLAQGVVAAHGDHQVGLGHALLDVLDEGPDPDLEGAGAVGQLIQPFGVEERAGYHQGLEIHGAVGLEHPEVVVEHGVAVPAAADGDHHLLVLAPDLSRLGHLARDIAREDGLGRDVLGKIVFLDGVIELLFAVDPDFGIEVAQDLRKFLAFPVRAGGPGVVQDVAQSEDHAGARQALLDPLEGGQDLAFQTGWDLVHDEQVRFERLARGQDDVLADGDGDLGLDLDGVRHVDRIGFLDHAGHAHEIHACGHGVAPRDGRAGDDEDVHPRPHQVAGDGHGAPDVSQTVRVVGVHQYII